MEISVQNDQTILHLVLTGRLDSFGATQLQAVLTRELSNTVRGLVLDMSAVNYLSSAGLRVLLTAYKHLQAHQSAMALAGVHAYCQDVLAMTGFAETFPKFDAAPQALSFCRQAILKADVRARWSQAELLELPHGRVRVVSCGKTAGTVEILGDVQDVLYARVTAASLCSKRFSETEYSIGLGGLGDHLEDYFGIMGEMITVGGTMVGLPTHGHDTPDFLIPKTDSGHIMIRTAYNVALSGDFNDLILFTSSAPEGTTLSDLYRDLFTLAKQRRPDFKGALGLAMRAQMNTVLGSGIKRAPIAEYKPANGNMLTHPDNIAEWFDADARPRHTDVTALVCGIGVDLTHDLSAYNDTLLNRVFYLHPTNVGNKEALLHNHAVIFKAQPMPPTPTDLTDEIQHVVQKGRFLDMRHLLDSSVVSSALIGVSYIQEFQPDRHGMPLPTTEVYF